MSNYEERISEARAMVLARLTRQSSASAEDDLPALIPDDGLRRDGSHLYYADDLRVDGMNRPSQLVDGEWVVIYPSPPTAAETLAEVRVKIVNELEIQRRTPRGYTPRQDYLERLRRQESELIAVNKYDFH